MTANPVVRLVSLLKLNWRIVLVGALLGTGLSVLTGAMSPRRYISRATVDLETKQATPSSQMSFWMEYDETTVLLNKAAMLIRSPSVLSKAATDLLDRNVDMAMAFPRRLRVADFKERLALLAKRMGSLNPFEIPNLFYAPRDPDEISSRLANHIAIETDPSTRTLRVSYEASTPAIAKIALERIVERYIETAAAGDRAKLQQQEIYVEETITRQEQLTAELELARQKIVEDNPELAAFTQGSQSHGAREFLNLREKFNDVESQLKTSRKLKQTIASKLASGGLASVHIEDGLRKKMIDEISQLQFKKMEYTQVSGYPATHPEVLRISSRLKTLNKALKEVSANSTGSNYESPDELTRSLAQLDSEIKRLSVEKNVLSERLSGYDLKFKDDLKREFELASVTRRISTHEQLTTELHNNLEGIRMQLAGFRSRVSLQSPPTLPVIDNNLSTPRRALFGFMVSGVFVISLIFLLDLKSPRLLVFQDLEALGIHYFGLKFHKSNAISQFASSIQSLTAIGRKSAGTRNSGRTVLIAPVSIEFNSIDWSIEVARMLREYGSTPAILVIDESDDPAIRYKSNVRKGITCTTIHPDEVSFCFQDVMSDLKREHDWVLIIAPGIESHPCAPFVKSHADDIVFITQIGETKLKSLARFQQTDLGKSQLGQYALVMD